MDPQIATAVLQLLETIVTRLVSLEDTVAAMNLSTLETASEVDAAHREAARVVNGLWPAPSAPKPKIRVWPRLIINNDESVS
jgi:hypothetical protein